MMWRQQLFSKRTSDNGGETVDGYHIVTDKTASDYQFTENIIRRPRLANKSVAFIQDCGDRLYIGVDGSVPDVLGTDHSCAFEVTKRRQGLVRGRPITFVQGYFAKKGSAEIPNIHELIREYPGHLEDTLVRANNGEDPVKTDPVRFSTKIGSESSTQWDNIAKEFQQEKHQGKTATFDHEGNWLGWLEHEVGTFTSKVAEERSFPKQAVPLEMPPKIAFLPLACVTLGVMTAGWLVWELVKALTDQGPPRH